MRSRDHRPDIFRQLARRAGSRLVSSPPVLRLDRWPSGLNNPSGQREDEKIDGAPLKHVSPIEWDNVLLYGQYVLDRDRVC